MFIFIFELEDLNIDFIEKKIFILICRLIYVWIIIGFLIFEFFVIEKVMCVVFIFCIEEIS